MLALVAGLTSVLATAHAQSEPVAWVTGTLEAVLDGAPRTFHAYAVDIPEDVADGVTDEVLRERLQRAAGTTEHTATWSVLE
ncbi:MAG: hypothetical protein P1P87_12320, partial [Trueperaceae bacterium]|nr:hypothetical protein [Trueperaceae bacterium]